MSKLAEKVKELDVTKSQEEILTHLKNLLVESDMPEKVKDIQNLSIHHFRDLTTNESELICNVFKVKTIKDFANLSYETVLQNMAFLRKEKITKKKLELLISAARFIVEAGDYKPSEEKKIVLVGLANAGKTALLKVMKQELVGAVEGLSLLKPTLGLQRNDVVIKDQKFSIFELGGQEVYRKAYIETPGRFFLGTDIILFLIDMQDDKSQPEALDYLQNILHVVEYLQESPEFIILLHKCDPDLLDDPRFLEKIDNMTQLVTQIFQSYNFRFEIQTSSIFHKLAPSPSFSKMMRGLFNKGLLEEKKKMEALSDLITGVVDLILGIEKTLNDRLDRIERQLLPSAQPGGQPPSSPVILQAVPIQPAVFKPNLSPKDALMSELKTLFVKKNLTE